MNSAENWNLSKGMSVQTAGQYWHGSLKNRCDESDWVG